jgi:GT2 family glycosyltransferase
VRVGVAVLTYRCGAAVGPTLASISGSTRTPDLLLVVDNASGDDTVAFVKQAAPSAEVVVLDGNEGYGPAMNVAVRRLAEAGADLVVCLTHDCLLDPACLGALERELADHPATGVAGPVLARLTDPERTWSAGGALRGWRRAPRHAGSGSPVADRSSQPSRAVTWLDGAVLAVRTSAFAEVGGFREDLFLYWEDIDLCLRLAEAGWEVRILPSALAWQEPSFTPPYLAVRNKLVVLRAREGRRAVAAVTLETALLSVRDLAAATRSASGRQVAGLRWAGLRDGLRGRLDRGTALEREASTQGALTAVTIVNPLPSTLAHYQRELAEVLGAAGVAVAMASSASAEVGGRPLRRLAVALRLVASRLVRPPAGRTLALWPVFGRADALTWRRSTAARTTYVVVHDPESLRRQLGMGRVATAFGRRAARHTVTTVVHGEPARLALERIGWPAPIVLPHPLRTPRPVPDTPRRGLVVLGQWKPARATAPLAALAADPRWAGLRSIHGRGWPEVEGWDVRARFLSEAEVDETLAGAECLVLPYDRYFQSNVAVRALESLTPVVGERHPFLEDLLGHDWPGLVDDGDWAAAVTRVLQLPPGDLGGRRQLAWERATSAWRGWAAGLEPAPAPASLD